MNQILLSMTSVKALSQHLSLSTAEDSLLIWRLDLEMIGTKPCIVAHEQNTGYLLVLCELEQEDFKQFPEIFRERLCRELVVICKHADIYDEEVLITHIRALLDQQSYQIDPEPMEEGRISKTFEKLEYGFLYEKSPLPSDGRAAFEFSFVINSRRPKTKGLEQQQSPAEALGNLFLNLIEDRIDQQKTPPVEFTRVDNIVHVDFSQQRK